MNRQPTPKRLIHLKCTETSQKLALLLNEYNSFYQNLFCFKSNIWGNMFFVLTEKLEKLYKEFQMARDDLSYLTNKYNTFHKSEMKTFIPDNDYCIIDGKEIAFKIMDNLSILIELERVLLKKLDKEKRVSMLKEFLTKRIKQNIQTIEIFSELIKRENEYPLIEK